MNTSKNYAGITDNYADPSTAKITLIPVSFNENGVAANAFLEAANAIELYDIETDSEAYKNGIHLAETIREQDANAMVNTVHETAKKYFKRNKLVTLIGGDRAISIGAIRAANECFKDISVLQIDAHTNLKKQVNGTNIHAKCALSEANQNTNLIQVGIRSMDSTEKTIINNSNVFYAHEMISDDFWVDNVIDLIKEDVFITFDLNALDPSILPSVYRPEPGGLLWYETLDFLKTVFAEKNVIGFDIVGLAPNEKELSSNILAAKLYYKMLTYKFENNNESQTNE